MAVFFFFLRRTWKRKVINDKHAPYGLAGRQTTGEYYNDCEILQRPFTDTVYFIAERSGAQGDDAATTARQDAKVVQPYAKLKKEKVKICFSLSGYAALVSGQALYFCCVCSAGWLADWGSYCLSAAFEGGVRLRGFVALLFVCRLTLISG